MKLLIAYDGSECAESALDDLTHAGLPTKGQALVMTVAEVWLPPPPPSAYEVLQLAVDAKSPLGLERKYKAASQPVKDAYAINSRQWSIDAFYSNEGPAVGGFSGRAELAAAGADMLIERFGELREVLPMA